MDVSYILEGLNRAQHEAVCSEARVLRILAGAGSGKTRVLVQRLLWLMAVERLPPYALLALTFTNKAAREMRGRLQQACGEPLTRLWMGTFHAFCHHLLRRDADLLGWDKSFAVMDSGDQVQLVKRLMRECALDERWMTAKQAAQLFNSWKEKGLRAAEVTLDMARFDREAVALYAAYEQRCREMNLMDFAELQLAALELLLREEDVRHLYQQRFKAILVDEFQDTNRLQYRLLRLLTGSETSLFVVGDDDQSIYAWRGACVENMFDLEKDFPEVCTIRLEQNYRSTQTILDAANAVIAQNKGRIGKKLWSDAGNGAPIALYAALNEFEEARYVCEEIERAVDGGARYDDCAVLYRSNAQSRVFEEKLMQLGIPYRVYGGLRFFERAEIKDVLAYVRLAQQPDDDAAMERVINVPPRGIGQKTFAILREAAQTSGRSLAQTMRDPLVLQSLSRRAANALQDFDQLLRSLSDRRQDASFAAFMLRLIETSGLWGMYDDGRKNLDNEAKLDNLRELVQAAEFFAREQQNHGEGEDLLLAFLTQAVLDAGEAQAQDNEDAVQLMTLHSAKGLEFEHVFMVGMEEELFPDRRNIDDPVRLEEERRLAYVGMTRAKKHLHLSCAERRRFMGTESYPRPSRFIAEIPEHLLESLRRPAFADMRAPAPTALERSAAYRVGQNVVHAAFGEGVITEIRGSGEHTQVLVHFQEGGDKWLVAAFAKWLS